MGSYNSPPLEAQRPRWDTARCLTLIPLWNFSMHDLKLVAVVFDLKLWRHCLYKEKTLLSSPLQRCVISQSTLLKAQRPHWDTARCLALVSLWNFSMHDLELAVVVFDLKIWRHCLYKEKTQILVDHRILEHLFR